MSHSLPVNVESSAFATNNAAMDEFMETFHSTVSNSLPIFTGIAKDGEVLNTLNWLNTIVKYNVPLGKQLRGRMVVHSYRLLAKNASKENLHLVQVLGWCVEILQAAFLVADDIMDGGTTRRGQPCWHLVDNMGNIAFNDALLLEHYAIQLLRNKFFHLSVYGELLHQLLDVTFNTVIGQSIDTRLGKEKKWDGYTFSTYSSIVVYKTAFYTIYLPVALAMIFSGISQQNPLYKKLWEDVRDVSLQIGTLFQIQDDYLDHFAEKKAIGKSGNDIEEGKFSWLFVTAKENCTPEEYKILSENYGSYDITKADKVRQLYRKLKIQGMFFDTQKAQQSKILKLLDKIDHSDVKAIFVSFLDKILNRTF